MTKKILIIVSLFFCLFLNILVDTNINNYINIINNAFDMNIALPINLYTLICSINALISIFLFIAIKLIVFSKNSEIKGIRLKSEDGTYGTSNWLSENEIKDIFGINNSKNGIVLGKHNNNIIKLPFDSYLNKNIAVFGSSGSMKTVGFLITNILELINNNKSMIITDPKAEIYRTVSKLLKEKGYNVKVFNLVNMKNSDRWNPLAENETITDVQTSADVIISNTQLHSKKTDDFWPRAEENLLKAFQFYFKENKTDENTLTDIYKVISIGDIKQIDDMFKNLPPESPAKMSYNIFASGSDTIKASVITGLGTRLQAFQNEDLQTLTSTSDIDLEAPAKSKCAYFCITSDMDSTFNFLASLFFTFLFIKLVRYADSRPNGKCDVDVFFLLDEFSNIGVIPDFNKKISTVRSRNIALIPILQNIGQIKNRYPLDLWQEIIGNCDLRLCLGASDILTAQYFSDLVGISTVETESIRKEAGFEGNLNFGQKNISTLKRNLLNADEILRIPKEKMLVVIRGNKPLLLDKMVYTEHPLAKHLKDSLINEYTINNKKEEIEEKTVEINKDKEFIEIDLRDFNCEDF